jgi:membrane-anchored mycosin MYCP
MRVKEVPAPVYIPPPDRGPITVVVAIGLGLAFVLGVGAMARRALRRRR